MLARERGGLTRARRSPSRPGSISIAPSHRHRRRRGRGGGRGRSLGHCSGRGGRDMWIGRPIPPRRFGITWAGRWRGGSGPRPRASASARACASASALALASASALACTAFSDRAMRRAFGVNRQHHHLHLLPPPALLSRTRRVRLGDNSEMWINPLDTRLQLDKTRRTR
jgi:hypothetical protein